MAKLYDIVGFLDAFIGIDEVPKDNAWNGLQFEGKSQVKNVAYAVDVGVEVIEAAAQAKADMLFVHHGLFWKGVNPSIVQWQKERIGLLYKHDMSLYAAHGPLDRNEACGNNTMILKLLDAFPDYPFAYSGNVNIGWIGKPDPVLTLKQVVSRLNKDLKTKCNVLDFGPKKIKTVAVCSGGGGYKTFYDALKQDVDLYITGDTIEIYQLAKDAQINVIFAGHYATEFLSLGEAVSALQKHYDVRSAFIDIPTGL